MASVASLKKRFDSAIESSDLYTAEQTCRTIAHRLRTTRDGDESFHHARAREALESGALALLKLNGTQSGTSLALDYVNALRTDHVPFSEGKASLLEIVKAYGDTELSDEGEVEKLRFVKSCIDYSKTDLNNAGSKVEDKELNGIAAMSSWARRDFGAAQKYFLLSDQPEKFAEMLLEWSSTYGLKSEVDLFLTRAVLEYALRNNLQDAAVVHSAFVARYGDFSPLANFCEMLLKVLPKNDAYNLFKYLCEAYDSSLKRDESFPKTLGSLGKLYYGVEPPRHQGNALQDMMSGVMKSLMGGAPSRT
ncbi:hypothetical protein NDN08_006466 [Rhodosorus marinus]|uniref:Golgi to ER traffic protein 4 n=1 Tax=Rhodosorus marinus TaxID=101924 RepID=A0AAV8UHS5_9RHOD|nr:hypothetical protein NDN08_006466 [Rhodosorus marinus]